MSKGTLNKRAATAEQETALGHDMFSVAPGIWRIKDVFVNVFIIHDEATDKWVLVDAGLKSTAAKVRRLVGEVLAGKSPAAIIMTHGHFDHRGSLEELAAEFNVPIYCHHMEVPYLTGKASYPPPDSSVGGGLMASMAFVYPKGPIDVEASLQELPEDGTVPALSGWRWLHTPGHTPGHISLFRDSDGVLIAGDAVVTTKQESIFAVMTQKEELSGPPKYFTADWGASARSVKALAKLNPEIIASGHGKSLYGENARMPLKRLAREFWHSGMPARGRYVKEPALFDEDGPTYVPPAHRDYTWLRFVGATAMLLVGYYLYKKQNKSLAKSLMIGSVTMLTAPVPEI